MKRFTSIVLVALLAACSSGGDGSTDIEFSISPSSVELFPGETTQLAAVGASRAVTWSSSNNAIATVVPTTGLVTAVARGMATISAVAGSTVRSATVTVLAPPQIQVPPEVVFDITEGDNDPAPQQITVQNAGDGTLQNVAVGAPAYPPGQPTGWLTATLAGAQLTLRAQRGTLPVGDYMAAVPVTASNADNSPQSILVTFRIVPRPRIAVARDPVEMSTTPGGTDVEAVEVTNGGGRTLGGLSVSVDYGGGATGWLQASLSGTTAPATLTLTAMAGQLPFGTYAANAVLSSSQPGVAPFIVRVILSVTPAPRIALSSTTVPITAVFEAAPPPAQTVTVTNGGGGTLTGLALGPIAYGAGASGWLTATVEPETAPATITLAVNQAQLPQGTYSATVPVTSPVADNSPVALEVTMTVAPPPKLTATPPGAVFATYRNGNLPGQQSIGINDDGPGNVPDLNYEVMYNSGADWLDISFASDDRETPTTLRVRPNDSSLPRGTHSAVIRVSTTTPGIAPLDVVINYTISTFDIDIAPLLSLPNPGGFPEMPCTDCHSVGSASSAYTYLTGVSSNLLICKITGNAACPDPMRMPSSAVSRIQAWINAGKPR